MFSSKPRIYFYLAVLATVLWLVFWGAARLLIVNAPIPHADVIAVLSGSAAFRERTRYAAELLKAGEGGRILLTNDNYKGGWSEAEERNPFYYELAIAELHRSGVPDDRIEVLLEPVTGTLEEARLLKQYSETHGVRSILVVTSPYHSRRALWTMRKVFIESNVLIGVQSVPPGQQTPKPTTWWAHVRGWRTVPIEYLKIVYYWVRIG